MRHEEPFINEDLNNRINWIIDDSILHDDTFKTWEHDIDKQEQMHLSELGRILENFTKPDLACAVIVAFRNYPYMVMQVIAEEIQRIKEGEKHGRTD